jgi:hypothetical protein
MKKALLSLFAVTLFINVDASKIKNPPNSILTDPLAEVEIANWEEVDAYWQSKEGNDQFFRSWVRGIAEGFVRYLGKRVIFLRDEAALKQFLDTETMHYLQNRQKLSNPHLNKNEIDPEVYLRVRTFAMGAIEARMLNPTISTIVFDTSKLMTFLQKNEH